ncbi:probable LRR receptor-like serine/threonine-protein kinase isoform X1 [Tanacetum coccineum]
MRWRTVQAGGREICSYLLREGTVEGFELLAFANECMLAGRSGYFKKVVNNSGDLFDGDDWWYYNIRGIRLRVMVSVGFHPHEDSGVGLPAVEGGYRFLDAPGSAVCIDWCLRCRGNRVGIREVRRLVGDNGSIEWRFVEDTGIVQRPGSKDAVLLLGSITIRDGYMGSETFVSPIRGESTGIDPTWYLDQLVGRLLGPDGVSGVTFGTQVQEGKHQILGYIGDLGWRFLRWGGRGYGNICLREWADVACMDGFEDSSGRWMMGECVMVDGEMGILDSGLGFEAGCGCGVGIYSGWVVVLHGCDLAGGRLDGDVCSYRFISPSVELTQKASLFEEGTPRLYKPSTNPILASLRYVAELIQKASLFEEETPRLYKPSTNPILASLSPSVELTQKASLFEEGTPRLYKPSTNPILGRCGIITAPLQFGTTCFPVNLLLLPIYGADLVLGVEWLTGLGPILFDYKELWMEFAHGSSKFRIIGLTQPSLSQTVTLNSNTFSRNEVLRIRGIFTTWVFRGSDLFGPYELFNFMLVGPYANIAKLSINFVGVKSFTFQEMALATQNFSSSSVVSRGGYGKVYKRILWDGTVVAIKRAEEG